MSTLLERIQQLRKGLNVLSGGKGLFANFSRFVGVIFQRTGQNLCGHPLIGETVVEHVGGVDSLFHRSTLTILGEDLIHTIGSLFHCASSNRRFQQLVLELHRRHIGVLNGFPVNQLDVACRKGLGKVIHGSGGLISVCPGDSSHVTNALDSCHGIIQLNTRVGELSDIGGHVRKRVNRSVRVGIKLVQLLIDLIQALAGTGHDGLDGAHLQFIFVKARGNRFNCERRDHSLSRIDCGIGDVGKSGHSHDFKRREFRANGLDGIAKSRQVTLLSGGAKTLQALSSTVQIQTLFEFVEC